MLEKTTRMLLIAGTAAGAVAAGAGTANADVTTSGYGITATVSHMQLIQTALGDRRVAYLPDGVDSADPTLRIDITRETVSVVIRDRTVLVTDNMVAPKYRHSFGTDYECRTDRANANGWGLFGVGWLLTTCDFDPVDNSWYYVPIEQYPYNGS